MPDPTFDVCECGHIRGDHSEWADDQYQTECGHVGCRCADFTEQDPPR